MNDGHVQGNLNAQNPAYRFASQLLFPGLPCVSRLALFVASCDVLPLLGWRLWWRVVSWLAFVVESHAVLTGRAGEGGGLILPALAKSAPTLPSPPRHPGTARCAACGGAGRNTEMRAAVPFFRVTPHSGAGAHGIARARGEPSDNLCSQRAEDGSPLERAQSAATPPQPCSGWLLTPERLQSAKKRLHNCTEHMVSTKMANCHSRG